MTSGRFGRLKDLLLQVADLSAEEQSAILENSCRDDPDLRREAEAVLAHHHGTHEILKSDALLEEILKESASSQDHGDRLPATNMSELTGNALGHHQILGHLGEGGMGVVYKARDERLGRIVALKVMRPESSADARRRLRFMQEARAASRLNHPGIVTVYEVDSFAGVDFIAMEYVQGPSLAERIPAGGMTVECALGFARQLADALAVAHEAGIVHRDLKPSNILIAPGDHLKIADFGLAKLSEPSSETAAAEHALTGDGMVLGTAAYMSPEQAAGRRLDARSDLFSLGSILYEMLSGQPAFTGDTQAATLAAVLRDAPRPLPDTPRLVCALVERCLRKDPENRFQSAAEVIAAIETCQRVSSPAGAGEHASIAVLPFANMSGTPEDEYLCEGLAEEIINVLTAVSGLSVIARTSAFAAARRGLDACEIGARLGVDTILEGSVRRAGGRVRVTAQLIETTRGAHLWSERYDREIVDVFALEDEIAGAISSRLRGELAPPRRARPARAVAPGAHEAYLEGRYHFARGTAEALERARACYARALELDPEFAPAHESMGELHFFIGFSGAVPPRELFAISTWHTAKAIELDDSLAEAHALLATLRKELDYNWPEVHRCFERAVALNPASPMVRFLRALSGMLPHLRMDEAIAEMGRMVQKDPLSCWIHYWFGILLWLARRSDGAIAEGNTILELEPSHPLGYCLLGAGHALQGRLAEAVPELEKATELSGGMAAPALILAWAYGLAGQGDRGRALLPPPGSRKYISPVLGATVHLALGDRDTAFEWLDRAIEMRDPIIVPIKSLPMLDPIRDDPRYAALLAKMNLA